MIEFDSAELARESTAKIKVIGVGGAGGNTVNSIIESGYQGIEYVVVNTDAQALENSKAPIKIRLGARSAKGLGSGANPEAGKRAAEETLNEIMEHLEDADIVFLNSRYGRWNRIRCTARNRACIKRARYSYLLPWLQSHLILKAKNAQQLPMQVIQQLKKDVDTLDCDSKSKLA